MKKSVKDLVKEIKADLKDKDFVNLIFSTIGIIQTGLLMLVTFLPVGIIGNLSLPYIANPVAYELVGIVYMTCSSVAGLGLVILIMFPIWGAIGVLDQ